MVRVSVAVVSGEECWFAVSSLVMQYSDPVWGGFSRLRRY